MKKRFYTFFPWLFVIGDILALHVALLVSMATLFYFGDFPILSGPLYATYIMVWLVISLLRKDYKIGRTTEFESTLKRLFGSLLWFLAIVSIFWLPFRSDPSRIVFLISQAASLFLFLGLYRVGAHMVLKQYRKKGYNYRNAVILGKGSSSSELAKILGIRRDFGINFMGYYDDVASCNQTRGDIKIFYEEALKIKLDLIYINERLDVNTVKNIIDFAEEHYIKVKVIPHGSLQLEKKLSFSRYGDFFVINVNEIPLDNVFNRFLKRSFDIVFSLLVTVFILSWLIPIVGILIKLESKGSVFFIQERNGENSVVFKCLKFRSMTPNDYGDSQQAVKNDPRVTKIGAFLRNTSLDEMPQFLNVLIGDMSVIGPRPHTVPMNRVFKTQIEKYNSRHKIRPGITGLAQVKGFRGEIENPYQIRSRVKLDYFYIQNWSIWLDLKICLKTVIELIRNRESAY
ncbi:hypothetical protein P872_02980 [Rhodonellum psychrophilum GCM71 = DSM 17998]|uniref:Bacterial sugar transferase domain-containing protein n=2 Tax=Rhodonellum TaxID=336827 RepID=U5C0I8_9BACT|nr:MULTISPECIES: exopolysaccharide biosynthesis polyprenyl glycosylphosphotransferase [Rhodonellum]ERM83603.1 hypothetical protein P872_02980 [Rhodonellum psychrophilum GCM71 = DSM 17998]SDY49428.1 putative colanic acid biosysnthesis UDP-glucose lipid carrier transferase [Rhodonellum ikkaensis]